ncbi:MAG: glycoside hydrolase family 18 protein [Abditibacteriaceae bacterium]
MKYLIPFCSAVVALCVLTFGTVVVRAASSALPSGIWVTGYYPGWEQDRLPPSKIDFTALTHVVHFSVMPKLDGTLDTATFDISPTRSSAIITAAHEAGRKVLLCVGGANTASNFRGAISEAHRAEFVQQLVDIVTTRGYDGLDIDMEPLVAADKNDYIAFITELHAAMNKAKPGLLLTAAVGDEPDIFIPLKAYFDHINLMTYTMSGAWPGWVTWHNSPLYNGGRTFPNSPRQLPSVQLWVNKWLAAGFSPRQLGIGIAFFGDIWKGTLAPMQDIAGVTVSKDNRYQEIIKYYEANPSCYHWDDVAQVPYLSVKGNGTANDLFISYDNDQSIAAKINYVKGNNLGCVIIWQLGDGYRTDTTTGQDALLQAVKKAVASSKDYHPAP